MRKIKEAAKRIITMLSNEKDGNILKFTTAHTGKMTGMYSLSTSTLLNPNCREHAKVKGSICEKCYAETMLNNKFYRNLKKAVEHNTVILTGQVLPDENLPLINAHSFRFEAFGDLINETQVENYFNIAKKNHETYFALWTKNPWIIDSAIKGRGIQKPDNLIIIYSSPLINVEISLFAMQKKFSFIDKVFTVYSDETEADKKNAVINCGKRNCLTCLKCYRKNGINEINELLK